ncbi:MAG: hypothetical protein ACXAB9_11330 [Candidatus Thorarchaeota archaeon]|jgi:hypothetical protein
MSYKTYQAAMETGLIPKRRGQVFKFIVDNQDFFNPQMVSQADCRRQFRHNSFQPRFKELVEQGVIEEVGMKRDPDSGCNVKGYRTTGRMPVPLEAAPRMRISERATAFFRHLAQNDPRLSNDPVEVVDQIVQKLKGKACRS